MWYLRLALAAAIFLNNLPVLEGQDWAREALERSPRHGEWVVVPNGARRIHAFLVYPEAKNKATAVIVIHENRGLTDWVRSVSDQLAERGYIAIAPDLLSGMGPGGGKTSDFPNEDAAREAIGKLQPEDISADLASLAKYVRALPAANRKLAVAGFCWGGGQSFRAASTIENLNAAFVFYGSGPDKPSLRAPVYGFYGSNDARVNATIPRSEELMKAAHRKYDPQIYEEAGHGFMRTGEEPGASGPNRLARNSAWERWLALLSAL